MRRPFAPDIGNPFPGIAAGGGNNGGNNGGGGNGNGRGPRPQFMPGQIRGLANDMQLGYGGTDEKWKSYLNGIYDPVSLAGGFNFSGGNGGRNGGGNNGGGGNNPGNGGGGGNNGNNGNNGQGGGFTPSAPRNNMAAMQMQPPQMGLLGSPMQASRAPQSSPLLGNIPPEVLAFLSSGMRR